VPTGVWRNGRRAGLRYQCPKGREGSSPSLPTTGCQRCGTLATPVQIQDNAGALPPQAWARGSSAHGERTGQARRASPLTNARVKPWVSSTPLSAQGPYCTGLSAARARRVRLPHGPLGSRQAPTLGTPEAGTGTWMIFQLATMMLLMHGEAARLRERAPEGKCGRSSGRAWRGRLVRSMALSWNGSWCNSLASSNLALSALVGSHSGLVRRLRNPVR
jgi:hypothetical protein